MARDDDDDDRPRKRRIADDDDDRPRKKRVVRDDDEEDEDERPRKKRTAPIDDEDDEDRPRKKRPAQHDDDDDEVEEIPRSKPKKKPKRKKTPMPGMLIAMIVVSMAWGGLVFSLGVFLGIVSTISLIANPPGRMAGPLAGLLLIDEARAFFGFLAGVALLGGGISLFFRRAFGRNLVLGGSAVMLLTGALSFIGQIAILKSFGAYQVGSLFGILFMFAVCLFFFKAQQDDNVNRYLR